MKTRDGCMSAAWTNIIIDWKSPKSWAPVVSRWLRPYLNERGIRHLQRLGEQDLCWDDFEWLKRTEKVLLSDVALVIGSLANALKLAIVRTYHGCRTDDAGLYQRAGIRLNNPVVLADQVRRIVTEEARLAYLRPTIERRLQEFDCTDRDFGRLYLVIDDRGLTNCAGHYLLYGSEWIQCVLGFEAHETLRRRGIPTVLFVDLPLCIVTLHEREQLARALLQEWTRIKVNRPDWVPELDFTFCLRQDIPGAMIVDHFHPEFVRDPFYQNMKRRIDQRVCPSCAGVRRGANLFGYEGGKGGT